MSQPFSLQNKKIWIAGHNGMVGSALLRRLGREECRIITAPKEALDLRQQDDVSAWMAAEKPDAIILAAAKVGGIKANRDHPAPFLYDNLMIAANVIHAAYEQKVKKLLFLGSSCIYPKMASHPITETALLTGALEPTNEAYAVAKIAGLKLCQAYRQQYGCDFISAMPCNLYGAGDTYDPDHSHVIPALITKIHATKIANAPEVSLWGSGTPQREFLYVDDLAEALLHLLKNYSGHMPVNIGSGEEITIARLAKEIAAIIGYDGEIRFDPSMPDGTKRKLLDSSRMRATGWHPATGLTGGLKATYSDYLARFYAKAA